MEDKLERWVDLFKVLGHPIRLSTLFILYGSEVLGKKGSLRFSEIAYVLGLPPNKNLTHHLDRLGKAGLIEKDAYKDEEGRIYPLYHITDLGEEFLKDFHLIEPIRKEILENQKN